jgi:hypothetical protein
MMSGPSAQPGMEGATLVSRNGQPSAQPGIEWATLASAVERPRARRVAIIW